VNPDLVSLVSFFLLSHAPSPRLCLHRRRSSRLLPDLQCRRLYPATHLPLSIDAAAQGLADVLQLPNPPLVIPSLSRPWRWLAVGSNPSSCSAHVRLVPAHLFLYLCHTRMPPSSSTVLHPPGSISVPHCVVDLVRT
jgi:hypothetical protein